MNDEFFYKYPTTPYLMTPNIKIQRCDKILSVDQAEDFFTKPVIVEEKIDGANLGISFDTNGAICFQNRGDYLRPPFVGQWAILNRWISDKESALLDALSDRYILFGEWCYFTHSVFYNALPDWFIAFDVYDKQDELFLSTRERNCLVSTIGLSLVPIIFVGHISIDKLNSLLGKSSFGTTDSEGLYLRIEDNNSIIRRAKYVRGTFSQSISSHWSKQSLHKNRLVSQPSL